MKDKKQLIYRIILIATPILIALITIPIIYGWYVRTIRTGKIDGSTKNVSINYRLNDGRHAETNTLTYEINNLVFFDIENADETSFFNSMAVNLEIKLTNTSNSDMSYTVTFNTTKVIVKDSNQNDISISYVAGYFSNIPNDATSNTKISSLENNQAYSYTNDDSAFSATYTSSGFTLKAKNSDNDDDEATINLYLIGVQEISTAKNTDFLYTESNEGRTPINYRFSITITGTPTSDSQAAENTTVTTTEEATTTD